jgi:hypothetical protein
MPFILRGPFGRNILQHFIRRFNPIKNHRCQVIQIRQTDFRCVFSCPFLTLGNRWYFGKMRQIKLDIQGFLHRFDDQKRFFMRKNDAVFSGTKRYIFPINHLQK